MSLSPQGSWPLKGSLRRLRSQTNRAFPIVTRELDLVPWYARNRVVLFDLSHSRNARVRQPVGMQLVKCLLACISTTAAAHIFVWLLLLHLYHIYGCIRMTFVIGVLLVTLG